MSLQEKNHLSPESTDESHRMVSLGSAVPCVPVRRIEHKEQTVASPGFPRSRRRAAAPGRRCCFQEKTGRDAGQRKTPDVHEQTAREYAILSTNVCPIKGQFHFLTWYQINHNSDNYPSKNRCSSPQAFIWEDSVQGRLLLALICYIRWRRRDRDLRKNQHYYDIYIYIFLYPRLLLL